MIRSQGQAGFQSTPPRGGRRVGAGVGPQAGGFNPRPRVGGDRRPGIASRSLVVSIHAPAWGATPRSQHPPTRPSFNPRPRVGGDYPFTDPEDNEPVSIHAPAWGATSRACVIAWADSFQSTPPRGGRLGARSGADPGASFNPRPRVGGDQVVLAHARLHVVSIHAPAWGATLGPLPCAPPWGFNPRPRVGGDDRLTSSRWIAPFQSTPPRGGRPRSLGSSRRSAVSIHAPAWGATHPGRVPLARGRFNPRPRVGGDLFV